MDDNIKDYLASIGRKGGQATSEAKTQAARENARKERPNRRKQTMTLNAIENKMVEIDNSNLSANAKAVAYDLIATEINSAAWNPSTKKDANGLSAICRERAIVLAGNGIDELAGMDELMTAGMLTKK